MFGWCKVGPKFDAASVKVNVLDGSLFGKPGYVRINIAVDSDLIKTAVERLNGVLNEQTTSDAIPERAD
jgi:bifunctional pyridoxal-dependent enzyme with beta-cystathionase and maltose regulon repressor activities